MNKEIYNKLRNIIIYLFIQSSSSSSLGFFFLQNSHHNLFYSYDYAATRIFVSSFFSLNLKLHHHHHSGTK